jgi:hypothetical protein
MKKKNHNTTVELSCHGVEELKLTGEYVEWLRWQEEGGTVFI